MTLNAAHVSARIPAQDLDRARRWYSDKLDVRGVRHAGTHDDRRRGAGRRQLSEQRNRRTSRLVPRQRRQSACHRAADSLTHSILDDISAHGRTDDENWRNGTTDAPGMSFAVLSGWPPKMPKLDRCAWPHACIASPDAGVAARSLAIGRAAPRK
jgi:catechol 2,3-dioxygenase-like lactoylglutathione lyase family enzyme